MKFRMLIHTEDVVDGCEGWEAAKYLRRLAKEIEKMSPEDMVREGVRDITGKTIGFWSLRGNLKKKGASDENNGNGGNGGVPV